MKPLCHLILAFAAALLPVPASAQGAAHSLQALQVDLTGHYLMQADGTPFFWLGDTAWELIHSATLDEADYYLRTRQRQGFNLIQTVVLAELDGLTKPTPEGWLPFVDGDPARPNPVYFDKVDKLIAMAAKRGLYVGLVPSWGDKLTAPWGAGPRLFPVRDPAKAEAFGRFLGARLKAHRNIIWILGGDRPAHLRGLENPHWQKTAMAAGFPEDTDWTAVWAAMAAGIGAGTGSRPMIVFHPQGGPDSSSVMLPGASWLTINGMQSGHGGGYDVPVWNWIRRDFALSPAKPTLDLEPNYEDHPFNPWPVWDPASGFFDAYDVRKQAYRSVFAGGAGVTYGHHSVWQMAGERNPGINYAIFDWRTALHRPGARQMRYLKDLILSRSSQDRIEDPGLLIEPQRSAATTMIAMRDRRASYAMIYIPRADAPVTVDLSRLNAAQVRAWWYDPRLGSALPIPPLPGGETHAFQPPSTGPDWVLVIDDAAQHYRAPGSDL
jgi:Protein of unknown function (DUF4038)/Putative collagen-binding domain of a collagenase